MSYGPISVDLSGGARFIADGPPVLPRNIPFLEGARDENEVVAQVNGLWARTLRARQPEIQRLRMLELAYLGFHYKDPRANRENEITNHAFAVVEGVWPHLTKDRPRPEVVQRTVAISPEQVERIKETAVWWQDMAGADRVRRLNERNKLKHGYCLYVLNVDQRTGMPYVVPWSVFDFYPDHSARSFAGMEFFFLAGPVPTRLLRHLYPDKAQKIVSDNYVSPSYDAVVRPYWEQQAYFGDRVPDLIGPYAAGMTNTGLGGFDYTGGGPEGGTTFSFSSPNAVRQEGSDTTFLVQMYIRDRSEMPAVWSGTTFTAGADGPYAVGVPGTTYEDMVPCCESGWRIIQITGNGVHLDEAPLDECFGGLNVVMDFDYEQSEMLRGIGEIDNIWPINRWVNRRKMLLNRALEHEGSPVLLATKGSGIDFDSSGVEPGDVLEPVRGSEVSWLQYRGPGSQQFEHLMHEQNDIDLVSGRTDVSSGQRPAGIEAASAIRALQSAANVRVQGKMPGAHDAFCLVLKKALRVIAKKAKAPLQFVGSGGKPITVHPSELDLEFDFRMAESSGQATAQRDREDMAIQLYQLGLLTPDVVLQTLEWPDWQNVSAKVMQWQLLQKQVEAAATADRMKELKSGDGGGSGEGGA